MNRFRYIFLAVVALYGGHALCYQPDGYIIPGDYFSSPRQIQQLQARQRNKQDTEIAMRQLNADSLQKAYTSSAAFQAKVNAWQPQNNTQRWAFDQWRGRFNQWLDRMQNDYSWQSCMAKKCSKLSGVAPGEDPASMNSQAMDREIEDQTKAQMDHDLDPLSAEIDANEELVTFGLASALSNVGSAKADAKSPAGMCQVWCGCVYMYDHWDERYRDPSVPLFPQVPWPGDPQSPCP